MEMLEQHRQSNETVRSVLGVVLRHVDWKTARKIVAHLQAVGGNKSFRNTILRISALMELPSR
jgi:hypothetical protein